MPERLTNPGETRPPGATPGWSAVGGSIAIAIAVLALVGWITGVAALASFGPDRIPMALSTAVLFLLLGSGVLLRSRQAIPQGSLLAVERGLAVVASLLAMSLLLLSLQGIALDIEHPGLPVEHLGPGVPIGHMSPVTAVTFLLACLAYFGVIRAASAPRSRWRTIAYSCAILILMIGIALTMAYLYGAPLMYESALIPPALTTSLAFVSLAAALFGLARPPWLSVPEDPEDLRRGEFVLFLVFLFLATALVTTGLVYFRQVERGHRQEIEGRLSDIADLKIDDLIHWRRERLADAAVFHRNAVFAEWIERLVRDPEDTAAAERVLVWIEEVRNAYEYDRITLLDASGDALVATPGPDVPGYRTPPIADALRSGAVTVSDLDRSGTTDRVFLHLLIPITSPSTTTRLGVLVVRIDPRTYLYPMLERRPALTPAATTWLARREGAEVVGLNDLPTLPVDAMMLRVPAADSRSFLAEAVRQPDGIVRGLDPMGREVLAATRAVPDTRWHLAVVTSLAELRAPLWSEMWRLIAAICVLLIAAAAVLVATGRRQNARYYQRRFDLAEQLRKNMERHSIILQAIGDAVIATDTEGRVELLNPVAETLTGWREDEARGRPLEEVFRIVEADTREPMESPAARVLRQGRIVGLANHTVLIARDGREVPIADSAAPIRDGSAVTGVVVAFRDVSESYRMQEELRHSQERFYRLFQESPTAASLSRRSDSRHTEVNAAWCRLFGYTREEALNRTPVELGILDPGERERLNTEFGRDGSVDGAEVRLKTRRGQRLDVLSSIKNMSIAGEDQLLHVIVDVTAHKRAETDRLKLQQQLIQAQKMETVGVLAGGVAHDFNNMLTVIMGEAAMARAELPPGSMLHEQLSAIIDAAERSASITRQLLAFARKQTLAPKVVDLNDAVEGTLSMLRRLVGEGIELQWQPAPEACFIHVDPSQIDQVLANLCANARDAIVGSGKIALSVTTVTVDKVDAGPAPHADSEIAPGSYVVLTVSDDGSGMDAEVRSRAFDPFFTTKPTGQGTGLGLATVYGTLSQSGGYVVVESDPGEGTTFRLYFPLLESPAEQPEQKFAPERHEHGSERVLLVEDDDAIRQMCDRALRRLGYDVRSAASAEAALALVEEQSSEIDLLVTDVILTGMNGKELADRLRAQRSELRVLFVSGYASTVLDPTGVLDNGVHFLQKPFSLEDFAARIREALDG